jgi:hypothetical protein
MPEVKQVPDRNGKKVLVGSRVRVVAIAAFLERDLPPEEGSAFAQCSEKSSKYTRSMNGVGRGFNTRVTVFRLNPTRWNLSKVKRKRTLTSGLTGQRRRSALP